MSIQQICVIAAVCVCVFGAEVASGDEDTIVCLQQHQTSLAGAFSQFGIKLAISGNRAVIGAPNMAPAVPGRVFAFEYIDNEWQLMQEVLPSDSAGGDKFGTRLAMNGDLLVVLGSSLYVFRYSNASGQWEQEQSMLPSDWFPGQWFGRSIDLTDDVIVVGANRDNEQGTNAGAAYVFRYDGSKWIEEQKLLRSNPNPPDSLYGGWFGYSVAIEGEIIAVGAPDHSHIVNTRTGAVFVFEYESDAMIWRETQMLAPIPLEKGIVGSVGLAIDMDGDLLVAGNNNTFSGPAVYVYRLEKERGRWIEHQEIGPPPGSSGTSQFSKGLALDGETILIGDPGSALPDHGSGVAWIYRPNDEEVWDLVAAVGPYPNPTGNAFGDTGAVSADNGIALVGSQLEDSIAGAAYFFDLSATTGDLDCDGVVTSEDLAILLASWGQCADCDPPQHCPADLNNGCTVNGADLAILLSNWG